MLQEFDLHISLDPGSSRATLRLQDGSGVLLESNTVDFAAFPLSKQQALFNLRHFVELYKAEAEQEAVDEIGLLIANQVLGLAIFGRFAGKADRLLRIVLPASGQAGSLAGKLAQIPWEIARLDEVELPLGARNVRVCITHPMQARAQRKFELGVGEPLRVLFVFAETRGSTPLGMRQERRALQALFQNEIEAKRNVVVHFLAYGVARAQLAKQIKDYGGYHIMHWSGHGQQNQLELAGADGVSDLIAGQELLALLQQPDCVVPHLCFLSACHSGDSGPITNWDDFLYGHERGYRRRRVGAVDDADKSETVGDDVPEFTSTAQVLLSGGVSSVVAMRFAVGDHYARELALVFYSALLASDTLASVAGALMLARKRMRNDTRFGPCDHATPLLFGEEQASLAGTLRTGDGLKIKNRCLPAIEAGEFAPHANFVGRTWELAGLGNEVMDADSGKVVALITGIGGMGKTAFLAEVVNIWQDRFDQVLLFQAKPNALKLESFFLQVHLYLNRKLGHYHEYIKVESDNAIYLAPEGFPDQAIRYSKLTKNLLLALRCEKILIVLDNFETNLRTEPETNKGLWTCKEPQWDYLLIALVEGLIGSGSRLILTCRKPLQALVSLMPDGDSSCYLIRLGPLSAGEACLYLTQHPALWNMLNCTNVIDGNEKITEDSNESILAQRLLAASRFHPMLMNNLARLCERKEERPQLLNAVKLLEARKSLVQLPELFSTSVDNLEQYEYLIDALALSTDELLFYIGLDARRLLWMIALANEPVEASMLENIWQEECLDISALQKTQEEKMVSEKQSKKACENLFSFDVSGLPVAALDQLASLPLITVPRLFDDLTHVLFNTGLIDRNKVFSVDIVFSCHDLVRERIILWMKDKPAEIIISDESAVWLMYSEYLHAVFKQHEVFCSDIALKAGYRAIIYCVQAQAPEKLGEFVSSIITSSKDIKILEGLQDVFEYAIAEAQDRRMQWRCIGHLADVKKQIGQVDRSLSLYKQAVALAYQHLDTFPDEAQRVCSDLGWLYGNWGLTLFDNGELLEAREKQIESAAAKKMAKRPEIEIYGNEIEGLKITLFLGNAQKSQQKLLDERILQLEHWWQQIQNGQVVPQVTDPIVLLRTYIGALDLAREFAYREENWSNALSRLETIIGIEEFLQRPIQDLAQTRLNHAVVLTQLERFTEAQSELEACLIAFCDDPLKYAVTHGSLANLFMIQFDVEQAIYHARAALAIFADIQNPIMRMISHGNLANYLEKLDGQEAFVESHRHRFVALIYCICIDVDFHFVTASKNYTILFRLAHEAKKPLPIPSILQLFLDPSFVAFRKWLDVWLHENGTDIENLQHRVDELMEQFKYKPVTEFNQSYSNGFLRWKQK